MKNKYPIQINDLRFQVDYINLKKIGLFQEYRGMTNNARLCLLLTRPREIKMISNGNKISEVFAI